MKIGFHRHVASLHIDIGENADVLLRGAEFSAPLPAGPLPEDLVAAETGRDAKTLYFEDFDGTSCTFDLGKDCKLTADNGGRFGRGLLVKPTAGGARRASISASCPRPARSNSGTSPPLCPWPPTTSTKARWRLP